MSKGQRVQTAVAWVRAVIVLTALVGFSILLGLRIATPYSRLRLEQTLMSSATLHASADIRDRDRSTTRVTLSSSGFGTVMITWSGVSAIANLEPEPLRKAVLEAMEGGSPRVTEVEGLGPVAIAPSPTFTPARTSVAFARLQDPGSLLRAEPWKQVAMWLAVLVGIVASARYFLRRPISPLSLTSKSDLSWIRFMEAILAIFGATLVISGITQVGGTRSDTTILRESAARQNSIAPLINQYDQARMQERLDAPLRQALGGRVRALAVEQGSPLALGSPPKADELDRAIQSLRERELAIFDGANRRIADRERSQNLFVAIGSLLAVAAVGFLRRSLLNELATREALQQAESQRSEYQHLVDSLPIGFFVSTNERFDFVNPTWNGTFGRAKGETANAALRRALPPGECDRLERALEEAARFGLRMEQRTTAWSNHGTIRHFDVVAVPLDERQRGGMVGFMIERTKEQEALSQLDQTNLELANRNHQLLSAIQDLELHFEGMVLALVKAVELKDPYTAGHSERVRDYSVMMGERIGLDQASLQTLSLGALVHDVGKIGIPDDILTKPAKLTDEEYEVIKGHPVHGEEILRAIPRFSDCLEIVRHHHERLDGSGYPDAIAGNDLSLLVRIVCIADSYDAMTSDRAYRKGLPAWKAIEELRRSGAKGHLDVEIVELFAEMILEGREFDDLGEQAA